MHCIYVLVVIIVIMEVLTVMTIIKKSSVVIIIVSMLFCAISFITIESAYALSKPSKVKLSSVKSYKSKVYLKWGKTKNTKGYQILRKTKGGSYKVIKTIKKRSRRQIRRTKHQR